jgi:8-oxo-dGTP pyrophosphatase MutT (NUDIX family)
MRLSRTCLIIFYNSNKKLLLQERWHYQKNWEDWAFFGGWVEQWESPLEAFFREAKEELDLDMSNFDYKHLWEFKAEYPEIDFKVIRNLYLIKTDMKVEDFIVLEWIWARYFEFEEVKDLKFPSPQWPILDMIKPFIF